MKTIKIAEALQLENPIFIDVRSPGEFADSNIPGSINVPLFSNDERAEVGTVYKQVGTEKARELGLEFVSPKLPDLVQQIRESGAGNAIPVVYCWRGGERSESLCKVLELMRIPAYRLEGGYKSYRRLILKKLEDFDLKPEVVVLHGYTGAGKTILLQELAQLNHPMLDLEGLAGHRGSAFGSLGIDEVRTQKQFDALLYNKLAQLNSRDYFLMEAESKRIGRVHMPDFLVSGKESGIPIWVDTSLEVRTQRIVEEYTQQGVTPALLTYCQGALQAIKKRLVKKIGKAGFAQLEEALFDQNLFYVTRVLLEEYYDPLYQYSKNKYPEFALEVDGDSIPQAVREIDQFLQQRYG